MLRFERQVVRALVTAPDQPTRSAVEAFVDGSLGAMPEIIRAGVLVESLLLGTCARWLELAGQGDRDDPDALRARLDAWEVSPLGPVRQYVRMFRSLVLFGENELVESRLAA